MNKLLQQIFDSKNYTNSKGETIAIHSETSAGQCEFIQNIIRANGFTKSLEIGFAFGVSTLAITEEVAAKGGSHCVIDKFQHAEWGGNGLALLEQAGYANKIDFHEKFSYEVLPTLLKEGRKFDFVYIDSTKQFDWLLVDFFFIDKLLDVNGIVVFDDTGYYSIRKLIRFISQFPSYKIEAPFPDNIKPGALSGVIGKFVSSTFLQKILKTGLTYQDYKKGINSGGCIAIRKIAEDKRDWKWHVDF
jgi:hypothetical protein